MVSSRAGRSIWRGRTIRTEADLGVLAGEAAVLPEGTLGDEVAGVAEGEVAAVEDEVAVVGDEEAVLADEVAVRPAGMLGIRTGRAPSWLRSVPLTPRLGQRTRA
jgi:hypothetical protein